jgi:tetratricopeptide (TPR) repeat protein
MWNCKAKKNTANSVQNVDKKDAIIKQLVIRGTTEKVLGENFAAINTFRQILTIDEETAVAHFELSELLDGGVDPSQSVYHAKKAVEYSPENEWYLSNLCEAYKKTNQFELAATSYKKLIEKYPNNPSYLFSLAEVYLYQGKLKESIPVYNQIEQQMGISEELVLHKNKIYLELNQLDSAVSEIKKLIAYNPLEVRYYGILAEIYENIGEDQLALENYSKIIEIEPDNGYVRISLYEYYKYRGQKDKSNEELKLAFKSKKVEIQRKVEILSEFFINSERNEELKAQAYELLDITIETHPEQSGGYAIYADYLARDYRDDEALKMMIKAAEYDPSNFNLFYQMMMVLSANSKFEQLDKYSEEAMELFPSQSAFYYFNGVANIQLKNYAKAISSLETGKDFVIDNPILKAEFYQYLGDANNAAKNFKQSDFYYDQALEISPDNVYVLNNYSYYLSLRKEKLEQAKTMAYRVNQLKPNNPTYMDTYGWVLYVSGEYEEAEKWLLKAIEKGGDNSGEVLEHYGDVLFKLGKTEQAIEYWIKASEKGDASLLILEKIEKKTIIE